MTGAQFENWIEKMGLKKSYVAKKLNVDPDTITARCRDEELPELYRYALLGIVLEKRFSSLNELHEIVQGSMR